MKPVLGTGLLARLGTDQKMKPLAHPPLERGLDFRERADRPQEWPGRAAGCTTRQTSAQVLASDASTAMIATTKVSMMIPLPTMTRQLRGPGMRLIAR